MSFDFDRLDSFVPFNSNTRAPRGIDILSSCVLHDFTSSPSASHTYSTEEGVAAAFFNTGTLAIKRVSRQSSASFEGTTAAADASVNTIETSTLSWSQLQTETLGNTQFIVGTHFNSGTCVVRRVIASHIDIGVVYAGAERVASFVEFQKEQMREQMEHEMNFLGRRTAPAAANQQEQNQQQQERPSAEAEHNNNDDDRFSPREAEAGGGAASGPAVGAGAHNNNNNLNNNNLSTATASSISSSSSNSTTMGGGGGGATGTGTAAAASGGIVIQPPQSSSQQQQQRFQHQNQNQNFFAANAAVADEREARFIVVGAALCELSDGRCALFSISTNVSNNDLLRGTELYACPPDRPHQQQQAKSNSAQKPNYFVECETSILELPHDCVGVELQVATSSCLVRIAERRQFYREESTGNFYQVNNFSNNNHFAGGSAPNMIDRDQLVVAQNQSQNSFNVSATSVLCLSLDTAGRPVGAASMRGRALGPFSPGMAGVRALWRINSDDGGCSGNLQSRSGFLSDWVGLGGGGVENNSTKNKNNQTRQTTFAPSTVLSQSHHIVACTWLHPLVLLRGSATTNPFIAASSLTNANHHSGSSFSSITIVLSQWKELSNSPSQQSSNHQQGGGGGGGGTTHAVDNSTVSILLSQMIAADPADSLRGFQHRKIASFPLPAIFSAGGGGGGGGESSSSTAANFDCSAGVATTNMDGTLLLFAAPNAMQVPTAGANIAAVVIRGGAAGAAASAAGGGENNNNSNQTTACFVVTFQVHCGHANSARHHATPPQLTFCSRKGVVVFFPLCGCCCFVSDVLRTSPVVQAEAVLGFGCFNPLGELNLRNSEKFPVMAKMSRSVFAPPPPAINQQQLSQALMQASFVEQVQAEVGLDESRELFLTRMRQQQQQRQEDLHHRHSTLAATAASAAAAAGGGAASSTANDPTAAAASFFLQKSQQRLGINSNNNNQLLLFPRLKVLHTTSANGCAPVPFCFPGFLAESTSKSGADYNLVIATVNSSTRSRTETTSSVQGLVNDGSSTAAAKLSTDRLIESVGADSEFLSQQFQSLRFFLHVHRGGHRHHHHAVRMTLQQQDDEATSIFLKQAALSMLEAYFRRLGFIATICNNLFTRRAEADSHLFANALVKLAKFAAPVLDNFRECFIITAAEEEAQRVRDEARRQRRQDEGYAPGDAEEDGGDNRHEARMSRDRLLALRIEQSVAHHVATAFTSCTSKLLLLGLVTPASRVAHALAEHCAFLADLVYPAAASLFQRSNTAPSYCSFVHDVEPLISEQAREVLQKLENVRERAAAVHAAGAVWRADPRFPHQAGVFNPNHPSHPGYAPHDLYDPSLNYQNVGQNNNGQNFDWERENLWRLQQQQQQNQQQHQYEDNPSRVIHQHRGTFGGGFGGGGQPVGWQPSYHGVHPSQPVWRTY